MTVGFAVGSLTSSKHLDIQIAWVTAYKKAIYSASTVERATVSCYLLSQEIGPPTTIKIVLSVDFLVSLHPPKSEST